MAEASPVVDLGMRFRALDRHACPPGAIIEHNQLVRGVERWYVDFDKCIPYFAESASCGICIAECPWTRPNLRPKLLATMARRLNPSGSRDSFV